MIRFDLAVHHHQAGRLPEAEALYRQLLAAEPNLPAGWHNLGLIAHQTGRPEEAVACFERALEIQPDLAGALSAGLAAARFALAVKHQQSGRPQEAEALYQRILAVHPALPAGWHNLGLIAHQAGRPLEAVAHFERALALRPDDAETHRHLGNAFLSLERIVEAAACYRRVLEIRPDDAAAHFELGNALLLGYGHAEEAAAHYRRALAIKPDLARARHNLLFALHHDARHPPGYLLEQARTYGEIAGRAASLRFSSWLCAPRPERLRVGLVSGDLRDEPVGYFLENLLRHVDPARLELAAYPTHRAEDALTARLRSHCAVWRPLHEHDDDAAARLIHADGVHVLFDLSGHTAGTRLPVFLRRPAPIQVSWLGYSATTGIAEMDYLLGDSHVVPAGEEAHFSETVWRLPDSYLCFTPPDATPEAGPPPVLSSGRITFGSRNNLAKMTDDVVALWARVLEAVPGSRLLLKAKQLGDAAVRDITRRRFAARAIASERLILEGHAPRASHLAAYHRIDIALDPFPYNGTTTSVEALWMGVPVIVRRGDRFISRVGESIVRSVGLTGWIAGDDDEYVAKAMAHAANPEALAGLRAGLRQRMLASPLLDAPRFARNFEAALWKMWRLRLERSAPYL